MRPSYLLHVFTGLLLGLALAGLFHLPGRILANQEPVPSAGSAGPSRPGRDVVVHVSPKVERALAAAHERATRQRRVRARPVKIPHVVPVRSASATPATILASVVEPPASVEPISATPEPTAPAPEPAPTPPPPPAPVPEPAPPPPPKVTVPAPTTPSPAPVVIGKPKHAKKPKAEKPPKQENPQSEETQPAEQPKKQDAGWPEKPEKQDHGEKKGRDK